MTPQHVFYILISVLFVGQGYGGEIIVAELEKHFSSRGLSGCFVVSDVKVDTTYVWNLDRAKRRFRPASTFKIPNAIIGLETRAVRDVDEVISYGGTKELIPAWEKDMNLRDSMRISNIAVFHQLAKREGLPAIKRYMTEFSYGNADVGDDIENRFWLNGPLRISAVEQVEFLTRLATGKLAIRQETDEAIREIILFRATGETRIYAKTGWVGPEDPQIGWWVGWVQRRQAIYPFAVNIDIRTSEDAKERIEIGLECLSSLKMLEAQPGATDNPDSAQFQSGKSSSN